jgi:hypothetical protein
LFSETNFSKFTKNCDMIWNCLLLFHKCFRPAVNSFWIMSDSNWYSSTDSVNIYLRQNSKRYSATVAPMKFQAIFISQCAMQILLMVPINKFCTGNNAVNCILRTKFDPEKCICRNQSSQNLKWRHHRGTFLTLRPAVNKFLSWTYSKSVLLNQLESKNHS